MNDPKVKQQIASKIKDASNILVTVSKDPSVDELSAALGLTLLLNKMDKHATAVFSGTVPPAITFLDPEKTFEETTDSLRDFIIALDKEKADHLRYKLEGELVKIYITPYRTTITSDDLEFSQGDYNVELVIALGVENKNHLDAALDGHGKILHSATVITVTAGEQTSNLGSIDWHESKASSLSEMLSSLYESMKFDKPLMDKSIATAWMTGIVAATDRFSNPRTSSRVMTLAAQLMAAGADQQLIAARLEEAAAEEEEVAPQPAQEDERTDLTEGKTTKLPKQEPVKEEPPRRDGELVIDHSKNTKALDKAAQDSNTDRLEESARAAERALEKQQERANEQQREEESASSPEQPAPAPEPLEQPNVPTARGPVEYPPTPVEASVEQPSAGPVYGGTLNATSEQAEEDKRRQLASDKNKVILSHGGYLGGKKADHNSTVHATPETADQTPPAVDVFKDFGPVTSSPVEPPSAPTAPARTITPPSQTSAAPAPEPAPMFTPQPQAPVTAAPTPTPAANMGQTLADLDAHHRAPQDEALAAVEAALSAAPAPEPVPAPTPAPVAAPIIPPLPPMPTAPEGLPLPPPPPVPNFEGAGMPPLPPVMANDLPPERLGDIFAPQEQPAASPGGPVAPTDPGQFKIPGQ